MKYINILLKVILIIVIISIAFMVYMFKKVDGQYEYECLKITSIAQDEEKISYLKSWVDSKLIDTNFMKAIENKRVIRLRDYPELSQEINLDWKKLGLSKKLGFISFNSFFDNEEVVESVSIGQGRMSLVINLGDKELGLEWPDETIQNMKSVSDNVLVYCGN